MNQLRPYQLKAVKAVEEQWQETDSTVCVIPTGGGKTQVFCQLIKDSLPGRSLVLVHRKELAQQAINRLKSFGVEANLEMAGYVADESFWGKSPVVVGTVQTLNSGEEKRMLKFKPDEFSRVIVDECHHATSPSWRAVLDHFRQNPNLRICGYTATPDRADEQALGEVFKTVAIDIELLDLIDDGWLVPVEQQMVEVAGLDFSSIRTTCGDLNGADLAQVMEAERPLQEIAAASLSIIGNKQSIAFTVSVKQAEMLCDIYNRHNPGMAAWVCGNTPEEERDTMLREFSAGRIQVMVNVGVLTEGFDSPAVECVIMGRPTKSRCLYSQMVGRATRALPGVVDGPVTAEDRKQAIANSDKKRCLVVDFAGNAGRHKLICTADILGGKSSDEVIERAIRKAKKQGGPVNMAKLLEEEAEALKLELEERKQREAARRAHLVGKAQFSVRNVNPFDTLDMTPARERGWDAGKTLSDKQRDLLLKQGVDPQGMPYAQAKQLLNEMFRRWNAKLCTFKQAKTVKKYYPEVDTRNLGMAEASKMLDTLAKNGWRR